MRLVAERIENNAGSHSLLCASQPNPVLTESVRLASSPLVSKMLLMWRLDLNPGFFICSGYDTGDQPKTGSGP